MDKDTIIYSDWMYIPKGALYEPTIKAALTFIQKGYKDDKRIKGWKETEDFILVPRDFYRKELLENKGFIIKKEIPEFSKIALENNIVLDKLAPDKSIQREAYRKMVKAENGVLELGCGWGKTVIALKYICEYGKPAIVVVWTMDLLHQWQDMIKEFIKTPFEIGIIQGKPEKWRWKRPITMAMIQTLSKYAEEIPQEMREYFGVVCFDEIHHLPSRTFVRTAPLFYGKRCGLSATASREDGLEKLYYAHVGEPFHTDIRQPLTPKVVFFGFDLSVDWNASETRRQIYDRTGEMSFPKLWGFIGAQEEFQKKVFALLRRTVEAGRKILVLSHRIDTLRCLHEKLEKALPGVSGLVIGDVPVETRRIHLKEKQLILGTMQLAKEGLDQKSLDTLLILEPFKAAGILQQAAGRILRPYPDKKQPMIGIMRLNHEVCYALTSRLRRHFKEWPTKIEIKTVSI